MGPRITINRNKDGEVEIWINESGRDLLVKELSELNNRNDHFHLSEYGSNVGIPMRSKPYHSTDEIFTSGKVLLRLDEWDAEFFPHVLDDSEELPTAQP